MVQEIINKLTLDKFWHKITLKSDTFYLIAIKQKSKKLKEKEIDSSQVDKIYFEIGIDSGIKDQQLTIYRTSLDFKDETSEQPTINDISAFTRVSGIFNEIYIKPTYIILKDGKIIDDNAWSNISIRVNL